MPLLKLGDYPRNSLLAKDFDEHYFRNNIRMLRFGIWAGVLIYGAFYLLDLATIPDASSEAFIIRFMVVIPFFLLALAASYMPGWRKACLLATIAAWTSAGVGISVMMALSQAPGRRGYLAGIVLAQMAAFIMATLRVWHVALSSGVIMFFHLALAMGTAGQNQGELLGDIFFLGTGVFLNVLGVFIKERASLKEFLLLKRAQEDKDALELAKTSAENATRLKDQFISLVSHDLRGPLGSVKTMMDILERGAAPKPEEIKSRIVKILEGLLEMVDQLLDISRLQTGRIQPRKRYFHPHTVAQEALDMYAAPAEIKGITLRNEVPKSARFFADPELTSEALKNLVSNSVKFCRKGDRVSVGAGEGLSLYVADTGPGVKASFLPMLFSPEVKTTSPGTSGEKGTGLGLPYCREILLAQGGDITAESEEGKGARFTLGFPPFRPIALVVDDQPVQRNIVGKGLASVMDVEIAEAENGAQALELIEELRPALVITDVAMPEMDGFALLKAIRSNPAMDGLPVIVMTASGGSGGGGETGKIDHRVKAFQMGASDFVSKPVAMEELAPRVIRFLESAD